MLCVLSRLSRLIFDWCLPGIRRGHPMTSHQECGQHISGGANKGRMNGRDIWRKKKKGTLERTTRGRITNKRGLLTILMNHKESNNNFNQKTCWFLAFGIIKAKCWARGGSSESPVHVCGETGASQMTCKLYIVIPTLGYVCFLLALPGPLAANLAHFVLEAHKKKFSATCTSCCWREASAGWCSSKCGWDVGRYVCVKTLNYSQPQDHTDSKADKWIAASAPTRIDHWNQSQLCWANSINHTAPEHVIHLNSST